MGGHRDTAGGGTNSGGGDVHLLVPLRCFSHHLDVITVEVYTSIVSILRMFQCFSTSDILYTFVFSSGESVLVTFDSKWIVADFLEIGFNNVSVSVCEMINETSVIQCKSGSEMNLGDLVIFVQVNQERLYPYGTRHIGDFKTKGDDNTTQITIPFGIPFWNNYYKVIYVRCLSMYLFARPNITHDVFIMQISTNGLVSFGKPYSNWSPSPFPYGDHSIPVIAPYWTDLYFDDTLPDSGIFYHAYENVQLDRTKHIFQDFIDRLNNYAGAVTGFQPKWLIVITWKDASLFGHNYQSFEVRT